MHIWAICKMTEHRWNKLWLTVAATSLNTRLACKLSVIKVCTATQLTIFDVISIVAPHPSPPCTTSPVSEGQKLDDDKINALAAVNFGLGGSTFSPSSLIPAPYS